jgi:hypothetical protein
MAYFNVNNQHLPRGTEEKYENLSQDTMKSSLGICCVSIECVSIINLKVGAQSASKMTGTHSMLTWLTV